MKPEILAQRLWTAAQNDPDLLANLRGAYRGRRDVRDALWWRGHPLAPTPAGRPDPGAELEALKAEVYCPHLVEEPLVEFVDPITLRTVHASESEHRLRRLMQELAEEDAALDSVLARVGDTTDRARLSLAPDGAHAPGAAGDRVPDDTADAMAGATVGAGVGVGVGVGVPAAGERRRPALLFAAGVAVGALAILGAQSVVGQLLDLGRAAPMAEVQGAPDAPGALEPPTQDVLQIFGQPSGFPDDEVPDLGAGYARNTIRSVGSTDAASGYGVYVARRGAAQYCIVVRNADNTGADSCASRQTLARAGLRVSATVRASAAETDSPRMPVLIDVYVAWAPDGSITTTSVPHRGGCLAEPDC